MGVYSTALPFAPSLSKGRAELVEAFSLCSKHGFDFAQPERYSEREDG